MSAYVRFSSKSGQSSRAIGMSACAKSGLMQCSKRTPYSITSSARASSVGGTSRPSAPLRCAVRVGGHREVKNGTAGQVGGHPQQTPMGVNDRQANRQHHPHAVRYGRKQWIVYTINVAVLDNRHIIIRE